MSLHIFTDGSYRKGIKRQYEYAGYAVIMIDHISGNELLHVYGAIKKNPTSQRAELFAILQALKYIIKEKYNKKYDKIIIFSDSSYGINCFNDWIPKWKFNGWITGNGEDVKNQDLLVKIDKYIEKLDGIDVKCKHVKGHQVDGGYRGDYNNKVDLLAKKGGLRSINN